MKLGDGAHCRGGNQALVLLLSKFGDHSSCRHGVIAFTRSQEILVITTTRTEREVAEYMKVLWSCIDDVIIRLQVIMNLIGVAYQLYFPDLVTITHVQRELFQEYVIFSVQM